MRRALPVAALVCGWLLASAPFVTAQVAARPLEFSFHVRTAESEVSPEGFVDAAPDVGIADSVKDIVKVMDGETFTPKRGHPGRKTRFTHVADPNDADIILTIVARGLSAESFGTRTTSRFYKGVVMSESVPIVGNTRWVSMVLSVDTYQREFVGAWTNQSVYSMGAWTEAAKILGANAAAWVMANEAQIIKRRAERLGVPEAGVIPKQPTCMTRDGKIIPCREPDAGRP